MTVQEKYELAQTAAGEAINSLLDELSSESFDADGLEQALSGVIMNWVKDATPIPLTHDETPLVEANYYLEGEHLTTRYTVSFTQ